MPRNGSHSSSPRAQLPAPAYPTTRMRRVRQTDWSRRLTQENVLSVNDLIWPVFVREGDNLAETVDSMPGVTRYSPDRLVDAVGEAADLGIPMIAIFPFIEPDKKDPRGSISVQEDNVVCQAVRAVKAAHPDIGVMCDAALDPFTSHGHDGIIVDDYVVNDETVEILVQQSLLQARAGCDVISPSDMMDGRIGAIRHALDENGLTHVQIMAYSAKYASAFYGPFRDAVGSASNLGKASKATYQMNPANGDEALREVALDIAEGADMVMVKPGMPYLDVVWRVKEAFGMPTYAYQVSGEYAMIAGAGERGWIDGQRAMMEALMSFKRAGADGVLSYFSVAAAKLLKSG